MAFRGIIIEESLKDLDVLKDIEVLSTKILDEGTEDEWHLRKVKIPDEKIHDFTKKLMGEIKDDGKWYAHFYHEDPLKDHLIVVFPNERKLVGKAHLERAIEYGLSIGIPKDQLGFKPRNVNEETW